MRQSLNTGHENITLSCQHGCLSVVNTIPLCLGSVQIHSRDFSLTFPDQLDSVVAMRDIGSRQIARDTGPLGLSSNVPRRQSHRRSGLATLPSVGAIP